MIVKRAEVLGYCMGVRRAVEAAERAVRENPAKKVYTLGPLIHNDSALEALKKLGIQVLSETGSELPPVPCDSIVVIRAHGVPPEILYKFEKSGCEVVNATCPRVLSSQKRAAEYAKKRYTVILAGDVNHGEISGISGYVRENDADCIVVQNEEEAEKVCVKNEKVVLLSQTTISQTEYDKIAGVLRQKIPNIIICNTICPATQERQSALVNLCSDVDGILVVGGRHSANTKRLHNTALSLNVKSELIENASEIPSDFFKLDKVGISAGASTPDFVIDEVEKALKA
ncbi:MAG: 4-hydroxy-3-methylbut-2-enyl diphosphate reductase [Spirochaetaceae bacterium]|nr:4-hydroxy-3-methylbut-2-enyl diphosphate reductase [Spirochaetaceae bacterium]